jgi:hypothetical protein
MQPLVCTVPTLAVSTIYCLWHLYKQLLWKRRRQLHQRVAYMLWVMAEQVE